MRPDGLGADDPRARAALAPLVGYDKAAAIAKAAYEKNTTLKEAALEAGVTEEQFDAHVKPESMVHP